MSHSNVNSHRIGFTDKYLRNKAIGVDMALKYTLALISRLDLVNDFLNICEKRG